MALKPIQLAFPYKNIPFQNIRKSHDSLRGICSASNSESWKRTTGRRNAPIAFVSTSVNRLFSEKNHENNRLHDKCLAMLRFRIEIIRLFANHRIYGIVSHVTRDPIWLRRREVWSNFLSLINIERIQGIWHSIKLYVVIIRLGRPQNFDHFK